MDYYNLGCYNDAEKARDLNGLFFQNNKLKLTDCLLFCLINGYIYAGLQEGYKF